MKDEHMNKLLMILTVLVAVLGASWLLVATEEPVRDKYLVILQAGAESHEGMARALHAMLYSQELKAHGHEVVLVFDGAGTEWIEEWTNPETTNKLAPLYRQLETAGMTQIVCDFCAGAFEVKESLKGREVNLTSEFNGHPSIAKWVDQGYRLLVL